jgi:hypothetical protein
MPAYPLIDTDFVLTIGVLTTFVLLAVSLMRMLGTMNQARAIPIHLPWPAQHRVPAGQPRAFGSTATRIGEPTAIDLARLDDDGGRSLRVRDDRFKTPMIPGARESGGLTTFGVPAVVLPNSPTTMDAATIAARQREGGGAPSERRVRPPGTMWQRLVRALRGSG